MNENIREKLTGYLELLSEIKQKTGDEKTAVALLQEILKDVRMEQIRQERNFNGNAPATAKQVSYLRSFGVAIPDGLTRQQASRLIENAKAAMRQMQNTGNIAITVP